MPKPRHKKVNSGLFLGNAKEVKRSRKRNLTFYPGTFPCYLNFYKEHVFLCDFFFFLFFGCVGSSLLHRLSLVVLSRGYSSLWCMGHSLQWLLLLRSTGSRRPGFSSCGSRALEHRLSSCSTRA